MSSVSRIDRPEHISGKLYILEKNQVCTYELLEEIHRQFKREYGCSENCEFSECSGNTRGEITVDIEYYTLEEFCYLSHHYYYVINNGLELHAGLDQRVTPRYYYSSIRSSVYKGTTYTLCRDCFNTGFSDFFTFSCSKFNLSTNNCDVVCGRGRSTIILCIFVFLFLVNAVFMNIRIMMLILISLPTLIYIFNVHTFQYNYVCIHSV